MGIRGVSISAHAMRDVYASFSHVNIVFSRHAVACSCGPLGQGRGRALQWGDDSDANDRVNCSKLARVQTAVFYKPDSLSRWRLVSAITLQYPSKIKNSSVLSSAFYACSHRSGRQASDRGPAFSNTCSCQHMSSCSDSSRHILVLWCPSWRLPLLTECPSTVEPGKLKIADRRPLWLC